MTLPHDHRKGGLQPCIHPGADFLHFPVRARIVAQIPVGRLGEPSEIVRTVAFLTANDAGFITGANIPVNGGYFMSF
jgi:NAD(P)-dependent dehydrogenase (short-subunit alcohol dehydrogenase family)